MRILKLTQNRMTAGVVAVMLILSAIIGGSFAFNNKPPKQVRLVQPNDYPTIMLGDTHLEKSANINTGTVNISKLADLAVTGGQLSGNFTVTAADIPGQLTVTIATKSGLSGYKNYQIINQTGIAGYDLPNGGNGFTYQKSGNITQMLNEIKYFTITNTSGTAENSPMANDYTALDAAAEVEWTSLNTEVIDNDMNIVDEGITVLLGKFTDRWGTEQTICYLFGVGIAPGALGSELNRLIDAIKEAEAIIDEYNSGNPKGYDEQLILDLEGAINKGCDDISNELDAEYVYDVQTIKDLIDRIEMNVAGEELLPPVEEIPTGVSGRILSAARAGDNSDWIEIAVNGGYSLILRAKCIKPNSLFDDALNSDYGTSLQRTRMNNFYNDLPVQSRLRQYAVKSNAASSVVTAHDAASLNDINAYGLPSAVTAAVDEDGAFALSYQEYATFCSLKNYSGTSPLTARENYNLLKIIGDADLTECMTRSPNGSGYLNFIHVTSKFYGIDSNEGYFHDDPANLNFAAGIWSHSDYGKGWGVRPAMWVRSDIF